MLGGAVRRGADFFLASHNKVSRLPLFYYESMKRPLYAVGAARQGEGVWKSFPPLRRHLFFMPLHVGTPFWYVRGLLLCYALCLLSIKTDDE